MNRVLVTGADGFTGRYLCPLLLQQGYDVHGLVRPSQDVVAISGAVLHPCDLTNRERLTHILRELQPSFIVHLAAISFVPHTDVEEMYRINFLGTRNLLEAAVQSGSRFQSVLVASSANVYGNRIAGMLDEGGLPDPVNDYAVSKIACEYLLRMYRDRLPLICVRPFNYTGIGQSETFLIPKIVRAARERAPRIALGNINTSRDFSDVRTVVNKYARLLQTPSAIGETFNVCSGIAYSIHDILKLVEQQSGHRMEVDVDPILIRPNEVRSLWGNPAKLIAATGMKDDIPLEDTIAWMLDAS